MLRNNGAGERIRRRYLRPGNGGYHFSFASGHKNLLKRRSFLDCSRAMGGYQRCFLIRVYHGLARVHEEKRFPNRRFRHSAWPESEARQAGLGRWNLE